MINCLQRMTPLRLIMAAGICQLLQNSVDNDKFSCCGDGRTGEEA